MMEFVRRSMLTMECPEGRGTTEFLLEWGTEGDRDTLNGAYCNNPALRDLSGTECQWSCWEEIVGRTS